MFEPTEAMKQRVSDAVQSHENVLQSKWLALVQELLSATVLKLPEVASLDAYYGGRFKKHTNHLSLLLDEMTVVIRTDPQTHW
jgi:ring-1,2-phenylacetyl-CoA epoxidase subunit PaaC